MKNITELEQKVIKTEIDADCVLTDRETGGNPFKTELFHFSFDANDIKQIVHIERTNYADPDRVINYADQDRESFFRLSMFTDRVCDLIEQGRLSKSEGLKAITKAAKWFLA